MQAAIVHYCHHVLCRRNIIAWHYLQGGWNLDNLGTHDSPGNRVNILCECETTTHILLLVFWMKSRVRGAGRPIFPTPHIQLFHPTILTPHVANGYADYFGF